MTLNFRYGLLRFNYFYIDPMITMMVWHASWPSMLALRTRIEPWSCEDFHTRSKSKKLLIFSLHLTFRREIFTSRRPKEEEPGQLLWSSSLRKYPKLLRQSCTRMRSAVDTSSFMMRMTTLWNRSATFEVKWVCLGSKERVGIIGEVNFCIS